MPLYDTLGNEAIQYIINQSEQPIIFASKNKVNTLDSIVVHLNIIQINTLINLKSSLPTLKIIVSMDPIDDELKKKGNEFGGKCHDK